MELFFLCVFVFILGYVVGWVAHSRAIINRLLKNPDQIIRILNEYKKDARITNSVLESSAVREIEIEQENGHFYLYEKDTGQFLAQGPTLDTALMCLESQFPGQHHHGPIPRKDTKRIGLSK